MKTANPTGLARRFQRLARFGGSLVWAFLTCEVTRLIVLVTLLWWVLIHLEDVLK